MLQIVSLILCVSFIVSLPAEVKAEELTNDDLVYYDTEEGRFVNNIDEYLAQLNAAMISPFNSTITNYKSDAVSFAISEPSKKCSNIFGHKWGNWTAWEEINRYHYSTGTCLVLMERWHYCSRTHCGASQKETDAVWISCTH